MNFKEYLKGMNKLAEEHPESLDMIVVFNVDEEKDTYKQLNFKPAVGTFNGNKWEIDEEDKYNSVCIN